MKVYEELGDKKSKAVAMFDIAQIYIKNENYEEGFKMLSGSYQIALELGDLVGILMVGMTWGMYMCFGGLKEEGFEILERSKSGFTKLGWDNNVKQVDDMISQLKSTKNEKDGE